MSRVVAALGGNAFGPPDRPLTMEGQITFAHRAAQQLMPLIKSSTELLISHGNGPQVGHILRRVEAAIHDSYRLSLDVCVAESEGELGFVLSQALRNVCHQSSIARDVVSVLTQVEVDETDPAFLAPDKPIGPLLNSAQAEQLHASGATTVAVSEKSYRRVVPSPQPIRVLEMEALRLLLSQGQLVIAAGGGGIPVVQKDDRLVGVEAVIDKDRTSALIAANLDASVLVIVTCVPCAYRFYNTDQQTPIRRVTPEQLRVWLEEGHFAPGSMRPKIEAAIEFASQSGRQSIICDVESLPAALMGEAGTIVESRTSA